jgi:hypothetical protein
MYYLKIKELYYNIKAFLRNLWRFRKQMWRFRAFDSGYNLDLFCASLEITRDFLNGDNAVACDVKQSAKEIDYFLKMIQERTHAIEIAEKKFNFSFLNESYEFSILNESYEKDGLFRFSNDRHEVFTKVCKYADHLEEDRWNKAFTFLQRRMRYWWD